MSDPGLAAGAQGEAVGRLHDALRQAGYRIPQGEAARRFFGPGTRAAIRQYQQDHALPASGRADPATVTSLTASSAREPDGDRGPQLTSVAASGGLRSAAQGGEVERLHYVLEAAGLVIETGERERRMFGPSTRSALHAFQARHGLPPTEEVDAATLEILVAFEQNITVNVGGTGPAAPPARDDHRGTAQITLVDEDGEPMAGTRVALFAQAVRGESQLGDATTGQQGQCTVTYDRPNPLNLLARGLRRHGEGDRPVRDLLCRAAADPDQLHHRRRRGGANSVHLHGPRRGGDHAAAGRPAEQPAGNQRNARTSVPRERRRRRIRRDRLSVHCAGARHSKRDPRGDVFRDFLRRRSRLARRGTEPASRTLVSTARSPVRC